MLTIVETPFFQKLWPLYWDEEERGEFASYISSSPEAGDVIVGSGGVRKVRWSRRGTGKSGGVRVIYFVRNQLGEVVLLTMYSKSKVDTLNSNELLELKNAIEKQEAKPKSAGRV